MNSKPENPAIALAEIGIIHSPYREATGMPIQPVFAEGAEGTVEVLPQYADGLCALDGFERMWLVYWLHKASPWPLARGSVPGHNGARRLCHPCAFPTESHRPVMRTPPVDCREYPHHCGRGHPRRHPAPRHQAVRAEVRRFPEQPGWMV